MVTYIWSLYNEGEVSEQVKYWVDTWEDLVDNFNKNSYGLVLFNVHYLIRNILEEIEYHNLKSDENRKYFIKMIQSVMDKDPSLNEELKIYLAAIKEALERRKRSVISSNCIMVLDILSNGYYFKLTLDRLISIVQHKQVKPNDDGKIKLITQYLIIEMLFKGYTLSTIRNFPRNIFSKYSEENNIVITSFPHGLNYIDYRTSPEDWKPYHDAIKQKIDSLSIEDRLRALAHYYGQQPEQLRFIFHVKGIAGNIDINIGCVNIYSTSVKRYLEKTHMPEREFWGNKTGVPTVNASGVVNALDINSSIVEATERVEKAIDFIRSYFTSKSDITISKTYSVVDAEGNDRAFGFSASDHYDAYHDMNALNLDHDIFNKVVDIDIVNKVQSFIFNKNEELSGIEKKINYAFHWIRKADESTSLEDKLLNYWIVIESLMNYDTNKADILDEKDSSTILNRIKEILPVILAPHQIFSVGWDLFHYLRDLIHKSENGISPLILPAALVAKCDLNFSEGRKSLKNLIDNIDELMANVTNKVILEKISKVKEFYQNKDARNSEIKRFQDVTKEELLMIYRERNKIVHNAHYETRILPYFIEKAKWYALFLTHNIVKGYSKNHFGTLEEYITIRYVKANIYVDKLKANLVGDLLEDIP